MKLPASSSLLLATLAISSSSSTLAAPAGEGDAFITTSSSNHRISALLEPSDIRDLVSVDIEPRASANIEKSDGKQSPIISQGLVTQSCLQSVDSDTLQNAPVSAWLKLLHTLPVIGHPVASLIEKSFLNGTDSVEGMPNISPDDLQALQAAIKEVSRALGQSNQTTLGVSSAVQSVVPTTVNGDGLNTNSPMSNSFATTSAAPAGPTNTTSSVLPLSAAADESTTTTSTQTPSKSVRAPQSSPVSPTIPGNPPNTPVPPAA
jgi:hypothetical protein